jgi:hypothetical protein
MRKELRQRLATEYRYAVTRMQEGKSAEKKLFYFSVFFGEAQRVLNFEWDRDLALIFWVTQQVHTQMNTTLQTGLYKALPLDASVIYEQLTNAASDLAACFETEDETDKEELCRVLGRLAEVNYVGTGNGSYLYEKGLIKF